MWSQRLKVQKMPDPEAIWSINLCSLDLKHPYSPTKASSTFHVSSASIGAPIYQIWLKMLTSSENFRCTNVLPRFWTFSTLTLRTLKAIQIDVALWPVMMHHHTKFVRKVSEGIVWTNNGYWVGTDWYKFIPQSPDVFWTTAYSSCRCVQHCKLHSLHSNYCLGGTYAYFHKGKSALHALKS